MNPKQFLTIGGVVLLLVGILGYVGIIGPDGATSIFGQVWFFDNTENLAHTILGIAGLASLYILPTMYQKYLVILLGIIGLVFGLISLMGPVTEGVNVMGAQLQNPADTILHFAVGAWALFSALNKNAGQSNGIPTNQSM